MVSDASLDLSIIIVNWKSSDYLKKCLASVYARLQGVAFETIVIDNASEDGCAEMLKVAYPMVVFIGSSENLGFARANNLAFQSAKGKNILFLNPDTVILDDSLERMLRFIEEHPEVGAVGAKLINPDGSVQASCVQSFPTLWNQVLDSDFLRGLFPHWGVWGTKPLLNGLDGPVEVDAVSGACFLVRREIFQLVGMFDEAFFMYADDVDLSFKITRAGYTVFCRTDCMVMHYGGASSARQTPLFADVMRREALGEYFLRHRGRLYSSGYRGLMAVNALFRITVAFAALWLPHGLERRSRLRSIVSRWCGILSWSTSRPGSMTLLRGKRCG